MTDAGVTFPAQHQIPEDEYDLLFDGSASGTAKPTEVVYRHGNMTVKATISRSHIVVYEVTGHDDTGELGWTTVMKIT